MIHYNKVLIIAVKAKGKQCAGDDSCHVSSGKQCDH